MEASALQAPAGLGRQPARGRLLRLRSDDQLVALFRMGHDDAFGVIHDRYRRRLFAYTRQMLAGSRADADDALQDVFIRAYSALRADDRPVTLRAWLYRVAHNRCVDQLRRPVPTPGELLEVARAPLADPLAECERREDLRRLVADVRRLPAHQRSALLMRELDGLSYREISEALLVSIPAVKSLLVRARVGLAEATEARDAACIEIRADLAGARERGVRASGRARRHLRDCGACRDYRATLRGPRRNGLGALLGLGAGGSGAAAGAGGGAAATLGGGATAVTATKVAAIVCCAALAGGAATVQQLASGPAAPARHHARPHARPEPPAVPLAHPAPVRPIDPVAARPAATRRAQRDSHPHAAPLVATGPTASAPAPDPAEPPLTIDPQTGGALAPDEPAPVMDPATGDAPAPTATTPAATPAADADTAAPPPAPASSAGITPSPSTPTSPPSSTSKS